MWLCVNGVGGCCVDERTRSECRDCRPQRADRQESAARRERRRAADIDRRHTADQQGEATTHELAALRLVCGPLLSSEKCTLRSHPLTEHRWLTAQGSSVDGGLTCRSCGPRARGSTVHAIRSVTPHEYDYSTARLPCCAVHAPHSTCGRLTVRARLRDRQSKTAPAH